MSVVREARVMLGGLLAWLAVKVAGDVPGEPPADAGPGDEDGEQVVVLPYVRPTARAREMLKDGRGSPPVRADEPDEDAPLPGSLRARVRAARGGR
jgi:hypothetical protein